MNLISIFILAFATENVIISKFLGICSFLGTSNKKENAVGMSISVLFVVMVSTVIMYFVNRYLLVEYDALYLQTITSILVIASFVQITELVIKKYFNKLYKQLGIYLPLITTNCAVFGIILTNLRMEYDLITSLVYSLGSSLGFFAVIYIFSTLREKIDNADIPKSFKGIPISLITAGIMALIVERII